MNGREVFRHAIQKISEQEAQTAWEIYDEMLASEMS